MNATAKLFCLLLTAILGLAGCATFGQRGGQKTDAAASAEAADDYQPTLSPTEPGDLAVRDLGNEGSLYRPVSSAWSLWRDVTANSVGDIVTVRVAINTSAEGGAKTELTKDSTVDAGITSFFGFETKLPGVGNSDPLNNTTPGQLIKSSYKSEFEGDGDTRRTGKIVADISAVVTHAYANGNMRIHGSQSTLINNENSLLTVDGIIRPSDISSDNVVLSNRIANADIQVTGRGDLSNKQRPGFLLRVLDWAWPL